MALVDLQRTLGSGRPKLWRGLLDTYETGNCRSQLDPELILKPALKAGTLAIFHSGCICYPRSLYEFIPLWDEQKGYVIHDVDQTTIAASVIKRKIEKQIRSRITVGAYFSEAQHSVLPLHSDTRPVLVLQLEGVKQFGLISENAPPVEVLLKPGDGLYIPIGLQHCTQTIEDSVHFCMEFHES